MTEATDTNPDLFPMGDFAGSGFDVGYLCGGEQSEPFFDDARVDPSETVGDQLDDWDVTAVNFAGSVLDGLHVFSSGDFQNALDRAWQSLEPAPLWKMPWETGVWKHIFDVSERSSSLTMPVLSRPAVAPLPDVLPVQHRL